MITFVISQITPENISALGHGPWRRTSRRAKRSRADCWTTRADIPQSFARRANS